MPIGAPEELAQRLTRVSGGPERAQLVLFEWRYRGHDGRFSGDGGVRVNPPDSIRLDLLEPGGSGVQSAVLLGDQIIYVGEQRLALPPPTFLWAMLGVFRPPEGVMPRGSRRGEETRLTYGLSPRHEITFDFDGAGRLLSARRLIEGDAVQEIRLKREGRGPQSGFAWPREARFRDLVDFVEINVELVSANDHAPFESRIFEVAAR